MIQRIQTLWLVLAIAAGVLSIKFPFYSGTLLAENTYQELTAAQNMPILILTVLSIATSLITLFFYKNRKRQLLFTILNLIVSIGIIVLYFMEIKKYSVGSFSLAAIFTLIVPIFLILALAGIRKDDKIIKSLDRLR